MYSPNFETIDSTQKCKILVKGPQNNRKEITQCLEQALEQAHFFKW